ncbi:MAG: Cof-type HAD-IIB family hydrolase [Gemmatimonadetes bacterium]|nr:Cof-type HAD-IIB family hydrolase [Gemmatimonadota bacterium]
MVKLVCIDIDGTLVGASGTVPAEVWAAAARARTQGIRLAICSGRPAFGLARAYAEQLDPAGWHVFQNGASVLHLGSGESRSSKLSTRGVDWLLATTRSTGRVLELYDDEAYAVESDGDRARRHAGLLGVQFRPRAFGSLRGPIVRAQWLLPHREAEAVLAETHPDLHYSHSSSPVMADTSFINITPAGVDKASAVRVVANAHGIPLDSVMMVGDGLNDLGVMAVVGHSVAMGNSEPEVLEAADYTVAEVDHGGLVEAIGLAMRLDAARSRGRRRTAVRG